MLIGGSGANIQKRSFRTSFGPMQAPQETSLGLVRTAQEKPFGPVQALFRINANLFHTGAGEIFSTSALDLQTNFGNLP